MAVSALERGKDGDLVQASPAPDVETDFDASFHG